MTSLPTWLFNGRHPILGNLLTWPDSGTFPSQSYICAYCERDVASDKGWPLRRQDRDDTEPVDVGAIAVCPRCNMPTFLSDDYQMPPVPYGKPVDHVPPDVAVLYDEARAALTAGLPNAAAMAGRKILMNVAVELGAATGKKFIHYVDWLVESQYVTPSMRDWVDEIRQLGNDANHEVRIATPPEADELLTFVEMLLRIVWEYPERGRRAKAGRKARDDASVMPEPKPTG